MLLKCVFLILGINLVSCINLDEYEPTDYDWEGMYDVEEWKILSLPNIGLFILLLVVVVGLVAGFMMFKKKEVRLLLEVN